MVRRSPRLQNPAPTKTPINKKKSQVKEKPKPTPPNSSSSSTSTTTTNKNLTLFGLYRGYMACPFSPSAGKVLPAPKQVITTQEVLQRATSRIVKNFSCSGTMGGEKMKYVDHPLVTLSKSGEVDFKDGRRVCLVSTANQSPLIVTNVFEKDEKITIEFGTYINRQSRPSRGNEVSFAGVHLKIPSNFAVEFSDKGRLSSNELEEAEKLFTMK